MTHSQKILFLVATTMLASSAASAWEVPGCRNAWNALGKQASLKNTEVLIRKDCPVMYRKGWVLNRVKPGNAEVPGCRNAWNALAAKSALADAKFLVTHNCPVIYRKAWR